MNLAVFLSLLLISNIQGDLIERPINIVEYYVEQEGDATKEAWAASLGNPSPPFGHRFPSICDTIRSMLYNDTINFPNTMVSCHQTPDSYAQDEDTRRGVSLFMHKETWKKATRKCEKPPRKILEDLLNLHSNHRVPRIKVQKGGCVRGVHGYTFSVTVKTETGIPHNQDFESVRKFMNTEWPGLMGASIITSEIIPNGVGEVTFLDNLIVRALFEEPISESRMELINEDIMFCSNKPCVRDVRIRDVIYPHKFRSTRKMLCNDNYHREPFVFGDYE